MTSLMTVEQQRQLALQQELDAMNEFFSELETMNAAAPTKIVVEEELNTKRILLRIRVTQTQSGIDPKGKPFYKVAGSLVDPTSEYSKSESIFNFKNIEIAYVDIEAKTATIYPRPLDDYETNKTAGIAKFGLENMVDRQGDIVFTTADNREAILFRAGQKVAFASDVPLDGVEFQTEIVVSLATSRYCPDPKEEKGTKLHYGVSLKIKQFQIVSATTKTEIVKLFMNSPEAYIVSTRPGQFWPTPAQLMADNNYNHVMIANESLRPKTTSSELLFIPIMTRERAYRLFTSFGQDGKLQIGPGFTTEIQWIDKGPFAFEKREEKRMSRRAAGNVIVGFYKSKEAVERWRSTNDIRQMDELFKCPFALYDPLPDAKITAVDLWVQFAESLFARMPSVLMANVNLYKTGANPTNQEPKRAANEHVFDLKPTGVLCDFVSFVRENALPVSHGAVKYWIEKDDVRLSAWTTPPIDQATKTTGPPVKVAINQLAAADTSYLLLNEWDDSRKAFIASKAAETDYDYYALSQEALPNSAIETVKLIREFAAKANADAAASGQRYAGPLADPLLWVKWNNKGEEYDRVFGTKMVSSHPLLTAEGRHNTLIRSAAEPMLVYAVDRKKRLELDQKAAELVRAQLKRPINAIEAAPTTTTVATTAAATTTAAASDMKVDEAESDAKAMAAAEEAALKEREKSKSSKASKSSKRHKSSGGSGLDFSDIDPSQVD